MSTTPAPSHSVPAATPSDDALLAELNGLVDNAQPAAVPGDPPQIQPPSLADVLDTKPAPAARTAPKTPQRALLADKVHAKAAGGHGYRVIVVGKYYAKSQDAKGNVIKDYRLPFNLPSLTNSKGEAALGIIVGKLLDSALKKMDPAAVCYRTHEIESVVPLQGAPEPTSISYMSFDALKQYVRANLPEFPIDPDEYDSVEHLREDVIDFKTNMVGDVLVDPGTASERTVKGGFGVKKTPSDRILERYAARKEEAELAAMNEGVLDPAAPGA